MEPSCLQPLVVAVARLSTGTVARYAALRHPIRVGAVPRHPALVSAYFAFFHRLPIARMHLYTNSTDVRGTGASVIVR